MPNSLVLKSQVVVNDGDDEEENEEADNDESCMGTRHGAGQEIEEPCMGMSLGEEHPQLPNTPLGSKNGGELEFGTPIHAGESGSLGQKSGPTGTGLEYVTIRLKDKHKKRTGPFYQTPDEPNNSDPFGLDEITRRSSRKTKARASSKINHAVSAREVESDEETGDEGPSYQNPEEEVSETLRYGEYLGVELNGFETR
ncbi:hypothetical protein Hanom_Chr07g00672431 [Helianthus anomalus]